MQYWNRMDRPVTTLLFDMDNTLFDFVAAQTAACREVARFLGRDDGDALFSGYFLSGRRGYESHENIRDYLGDHSLPAEAHYAEACRIYERVKLEQIAAYPGAGETLEILKERGFTMGVITDAHSRDAVRRLEKAGLLSRFDGIVSFDMVLVKKPAPQPFLVALGMMRAEPEETVLVGDSPRRDIRPARDLGMTTVYARYGDRLSTVRECPEAHYIIERMDELLAIPQLDFCIRS